MRILVEPAIAYLAVPELPFYAGFAETTGLEVNLAAQLADKLSLTASAGTCHNSLTNGGPVGLYRRPYVPDYTAGLVANYEHPLTPVITVIATLGFRHRSGGRVPGSVEIDMDSYCKYPQTRPTHY